MVKYLLLLLTLSPLLMAGGRVQDETSFFIESIRLTNIRHVSREIIISESRLEEGQDYTEKQLKNSVGRILRLPFVLDVKFSLEKGTSKGNYVLVVDIKETSLFFFNFGTERNYRDTASHRSTNRIFDVGARFFIGTAGLFYVSYAPNEDHFNDPEIYRLGYSHYNLFNRNIFANLTLTQINDEDRDFTSFNGSRYIWEFDPTLDIRLDLSIPVAANQWIKSSIAYTDQDRSTTQIDGDISLERDYKLDGKHARITWELNTTNDNFLPTDGRRIQVGGSYSDYNNVSLRSLDFHGSQVFQETQNRDQSWFATYVHHNEISPRQSWSFGGDLTYEKRRLEWEDLTPGLFDQYSNYDLLTTRLHIGYSVDMWGQKRTRKYGDLRFLIDGWLVHRDNSVIEDLFGYGDYRIEFAFTYRMRWGVISLRGRYDQGY